MPIEQAVKEIYRIEHKIEKINHKKSQSAIGLVNLNILEKQLEEYSNGLKEQFYVPEENVLDIVNDAKKEELSEYEPKEKKSIEDAQRTDNKKML